MNRNFPGKTSSSYGRERSCKKSEKSLERFSWNFVHGPTNYQLPGTRTIPSTVVENCKGLTAWLHFSTSKLLNLINLLKISEALQILNC